MTPRQGEIWWAEIERGRRPVLVITRNRAVEALTTILVAPVTRTVRGIPTELGLGPDQGLPEGCVASFDNIGPVPKAFLTERIGRVPSQFQICECLHSLADC